jgi:DNA-binding response OmpR family regulator
MLFIVEDRVKVADHWAMGLTREGLASTTLSCPDFEVWMNTAVTEEMAAVEAFLMANSPQTKRIVERLRRVSQAPILVSAVSPTIDEVLSLFAAGVDDVVSAMIHIREVIARLGAINRRLHASGKVSDIGGLRVFYDGRDPQYMGQTISLPRRELRILEYLIVNRSRRVTRSQIFNAVYGVFDSDFGENVIESHISKLRKKLKLILGYDPIDSRRYLGYQFIASAPPCMPRREEMPQPSATLAA